MATVAQLILVVAGVGLRLRQYIFDRSLWSDEAMIVENVIHRSYGGLTHKLDYLQAAPIGWLWIEKTSTELFGTGEMALRLPELLLGCAAVVGFAALVRRLLGPLAATVAVALFALSPPLVFFASDTKPYGSDAAVAVALLLAATAPGEWSLRREGAFAALGAVAVLISYPALFVFGAIVAVRVLGGLRRRDIRSAAVAAALAVPTLAVFVAQYFVSVRPTSDAALMKQFWASGYAPRPLGLSSAGHWLIHASNRVARYPLEASVPVLVLVLAAAGSVAGIRRGSRVAWAAAVVAGAAVLAAVAARYPLRDRMTVFCIPLVILLVGWSVDLTRRWWLSGLTAVAAIVAFAGTFPHAFDLLSRPYRVTEFRQALEYAEAHARPGDGMLVNYQAGVLDLYYTERLGPHTTGTFLMSPAFCDSRVPLGLRPGQRVWLVFGTFVDIPPAPSTYLAAFRSVGHEDLWHPTSAGAGAALYTIGPAAPTRIGSTQGCVGFGPPPGAG